MTTQIRCFWRFFQSRPVRGKKRAREDIEMFVLDYYSAEKINEDEYELIIPYENDEGLENEIEQILQGMSSHADTRNCYIESSSQALLPRPSPLRTQHASFPRTTLKP